MNLRGEVLVPRATLIAFQEFLMRFYSSTRGVAGEEVEAKLKWLGSLLEEPNAEEEVSDTTT